MAIKKVHNLILYIPILGVHSNIMHVATTSSMTSDKLNMKLILFPATVLTNKMVILTVYFLQCTI